MISERDYETLSAYVDGQLGERERNALETRLAGDRELRHTLKALRQDKLLLQKLPTLNTPRNFTLTRAQAAAIRPPRRRGFFTFSAFATMRMVTGLASLLFVTLLGLDLARSGGLARPPMAAPLADTASETIAGSAAPEEAMAPAATPEIAGIQIAETPSEEAGLYATGPVTDGFTLESPLGNGMGGGLITPEADTLTAEQLTGKVSGSDALETTTPDPFLRTSEQDTQAAGDSSLTTLSQLASETPPAPSAGERDLTTVASVSPVQPWTIGMGVAALVLAAATVGIWLLRRTMG